MGPIQTKIYSFCGKFFRMRLRAKFNGSILRVDRAPEPLDVFWENLGLSWWAVTRKRLATVFASLFLIGCCFGMIMGISYMQVRY